jgi:hypothetical protein
MKAGGIIMLAALLISGSAWSGEIYCESNHTHPYNGGEFHSKWYVVNSSVRKAQLPGQKKPSTACYVSWSSVGAMYRPIEIIEKPKLGQAAVFRTYTVGYRSAKNGQDSFAYRLHWVDARTGKLSSAVIRVDIQVVDKPL